MQRLALFSLVPVFLAAGARAEAPRRLTFQGAIELALGEHPEVAAAREAVAGAEARARGARARRLPTLGVAAAGNLWREAYALDFGGQSFVLHERTTTATSVTVAQPLTGLAYLSELVGAAEHDAAASRHDYDRARLDAAYRTADAYLRALEAHAAAEVARQTAADLQGELARAQELRRADAYTDIDVLRFRSAKAAADQSALRADAVSETALAGLAVQLGLHDGAPIEIADDLPPAPPALARTLEQAQQRALAARPELLKARERLAAADDLRRAARTKYLPEVRAVGVWQHLTGVQPFQPRDEEYAGVQLAWNMWDWGATHQGVVEAEHAQRAAAIGADALVDQVKLDVRRRWLEARTAYDSLAAARTQEEAAEEAYRLQKVRLANAAATATDVLDAETEAARGRLGVAVARYDYYLALVALARAVGDLPGPAAR
ncbi:MAG TPA: TolC family protein [Kofleriaceae bacterium]|nr:TolC family protein [Kofleriaceae bacterium]